MLSPQYLEASRAWLVEVIGEMTEELRELKPSEFAEEVRYLPASVTPFPGPFNFEINPFMREIVDCFDVNSPVREVNLRKGVQITYTTALETVMLYVMAHLKTVPMMFVTADKELASARVENNVLPMIQLSGLGDIIKSSDEGNSRKTGKTKDHLQWVGGGYMIPAGANNANKMRMFSILFMLKDEIDAWLDTVGKDGDPDKLTDDRCAAYWERRKIFRGSTPLLRGSSKIQKQYERGDQRKYLVRCLGCGYPQELIWQSQDKDTGTAYGMHWETDGGILIPESVRYLCKECGHPHHEHDKVKLFAPEHGAEWVPTARPVEQGIRSYHLPALYSPVGMQPWSKSVLSWLDAWDVENNRVRDVGKLQVFYNNVLALPFEVSGAKIRLTSVSAHRRAVYRFGEIPNEYAEKYSGSKILFLTCMVDVQKRNLAVAVFGWCRDSRPYVVDYWRFERRDEEDDCMELSSPVWDQLRTLIEDKVYEAADGTRYGIAMTLIDSNGAANDTVVKFCSDYDGWVFPIVGRPRPARSQSIKEFGEFTTQSGTVGYGIVVDHYKDRMAPVLRREWTEDMGLQERYHFNAPIDITQAQLTELTKEVLKEKVDDRGVTSYVWHRLGNAENELWDLLGYGHAGVEIMAWIICVKHFELETIDWPRFWDWVAENPPGVLTS